MDKLEKHLDFGAIAELTGMTRDWVRRAWRRGEFGNNYIDTSRNCSGHEIRIPESAVKEYLQRRSFHLKPVAVETTSSIRAVG